MKLLYISTSPNGENSASRKVSDYLVSKLKSSEITNLDLARNPLPHIDGLAISAFFSPAESHSPEQKTALQRSDEKVNE